MDLVCDTNVWYDIVRGSRAPTVLKTGGNHLLASPVSYLEIVSKINEQNFSQRQAVCKAVLDHADEFLIDPDSHLAQLWGFNVQPTAINWHEAFGTVADAKNLNELITGVSDASRSGLRKTNVALAEKWRTDRSEHFVDEIEQAIDWFLPGYAAARRAKKAHFMNKPLADLFTSALRQPLLQRLLGASTRYRASVRAGTTPEDPSKEALDSVYPAIAPYIAVYVEYLGDAGSRCPPHLNDLGDLECFIYLQDNRRLLTRERRWIDLAADADQTNWLLDPEAGRS